MGFLDIKNATKSYGNVEVLHNVDIAVEEGEFLVLGDHQVVANQLC